MYSAVEKAAALIESIVKNHPFMDGNKRTGYAAVRILLRQGRKDIKATEEAKYESVIKIAEGKGGFEQWTMNDQGPVQKSIGTYDAKDYQKQFEGN